MVESLEGKTREELLKLLVLFSLEQKRLRGDLVVAYSFPMRGSGREGSHLLSHDK